MHFGKGQVLQRKIQAKLVLGSASGSDLRERLVGDAVERRGFDHLRHIAQIAAHLGADVHHDIAQVGYLQVQLAQRCGPVLPDTSGGALDEKAVAVDLQLACGLLHLRPRHFVAPLCSAQQAAGSVLHAQALERGFDGEHALVVAAKRETVYGAFEFDSGLAETARQ